MADQGLSSGVDGAAVTNLAQDFSGDGLSDILSQAGNGDVGLWLNGPAGSFTSNDLGVVASSWSIQAVGDFNGDGKADILWRNTNGAVCEWLSNPGSGFTGLTGPIVATADPSWVIQGAGDFNGDGLSDILWRNADGRIDLWLNAGGGAYTSVDVSQVVSSWTIQGIGDFNGDGKSDILWRNSNGSVVEWLSNPGVGYTGFASTPTIATIPSSLRIQGVGDFDDDGLSDILLRNTNGDVSLWLTNASGGFTTIDVGVVATSWTVQAVGDYNGDGKADILWRNPNGQVDEWLSNPGTGYTGFTSVSLGTHPASLGFVSNSPPAVQGGLVVANVPQDFNGDGLSDILSQATDGDVGLWLTGSTAIFATHDLGLVASSWSMQAVGDFNGDGKADILWRNTSGAVAEWLSNPGGGFRGFTGPVVANVDTGWVIQGAGDFDGDGLSDVLWRNADGRIDLWLNATGGAFTSVDVSQVVSSWTIQGIGDFNGDGKSDILWRNANGSVVEWLSNQGAGFTGFTSTATIGALTSSWKIQGVGDFDGDRLSDILLRNTNGDVNLWLTNPSGGFTTVDVGVVATSWSVQAVGDYNGDGKADILWRNTSGDVVEWLSNPGSGYAGFTSVDLGSFPTNVNFFGNNPPATAQGGSSAGKLAQAMASAGASAGATTAVAAAASAASIPPMIATPGLVSA
jgi:hypothetical protein